MAVSVSCPGCATTISVSEELLGNKLRCKSCKEMFVATAAKVAAGVKGKDERIQTKPSVPTARTNGQAPRGATISRSNAGTGTKSGNGKMLTIIGGGAFAVMAGVTLWALFGRGGNDSKTTVPPVAGNTKSGLNLNDPVAAEVVDQPEAKAKPAEVAEKPAPKKFGQAEFIATAARPPLSISPAMITKVKKSSALIKCASQDGGGGTGSGWFAEPGIIVTNSHVVGMSEPAEAPPAWVKVVTDSGAATERTFDAKILGLDRANDLAILRIEGENLPDPMPVGRSAELSDGQRLYTIGFPMPSDVASVAKGIFEGEQNVVHTVKSRETHVAGRMPEPSGSIKYIQIEGGSDHGNSGGMIVDTAGVVRCIVVLGIPGPRGAQLDFVIPSEYAVYLLQGRILKIFPAQPYEANGKVRQQITAMVADPMKRIKRVALDLWTGEPSKKMRPSSDTQPSPNPGDSPRQSMTLAYDANTVVPIGDAIEAKGEWDVLPLPDGKVYWVQPHYTGFDGKERWGEALALPMGGLPVQRKPVMLGLKHAAGSERTVEIDSQFGVGATPVEGELQFNRQHLRFRLNEKTLAVQPDGSGKLRLAYHKLAYSDQQTDEAYRKMAPGLLEAISNLTTDLVMTKNGAMRSPQANFQKVPLQARPYVERMNLQNLQSLEALTLALPGREVQPGETWTSGVNQSVVAARGMVENALYQMTYRYDGVRVREGREEAVIEFDGKVARAPGESAPMLPDAVDPMAKTGGKGKEKQLRTRGLHGYVRGAALVDLQTGAVSLARSISELEFHVSYGVADFKFGAATRVELHREVAPGALTWQAKRYLPNQELLMNPFVGAPDVSSSSAP